MSKSKHKTSQSGSESLEQLVAGRLQEFVKQASQFDGHGLYMTVIQCVEKPLIEAALAEAQGNQVAAAKILGIHRNTLRRKIKEFKLKP